MKRKVYYQVSVILYIGLALFLSIMAACIYVIVEFFRLKLKTATIEWLFLIAAIGVFLFMLYTFLRIAKNRIILENEEIFVPAHWGRKENKIQYETHISYSEIQDIFIISSDKNSLNQTARWVFTPMPYIIFACKDNSQKAINVFYFSKKQVIGIIDEVKRRANQCGNELNVVSGTEILNDFLNKAKKIKK